jgi:hypothetical protein
MPEDKFEWDYSYFKWQDIPVEVRREWVKVRNVAARTWLRGKTTLLGDVSLRQAARLYRENWDGCRDLWKENYRRRKLIRFLTDHPITPGTR